MGALYTYLIDAGFQADYLDRCTLLDLDLFTRQTNERLKKQAEAMRRKG
jgi:hypothetical protein